MAMQKLVKYGGPRFMKNPYNKNMGKRSFSAACFASLFWVILQSCHAAVNIPCAPSSCGQIGNISYPFRLQTDPPNCGNHNFTLYCENNSTVLYLNNSGRFLVQAINYDDFTIRLVDAGVQIHNCSSLPLFPLDNDNGLLDPYSSNIDKALENGGLKYIPYVKTLVFVSCRTRVNSGVYVETASCFPSNHGYSYVIVGSEFRWSPSASDMEPSCRVDMMTLAAENKEYHNKSYLEIHRQLADGFHLSWYHLYCTHCSTECVLDETNHPVCYTGGALTLYKFVGALLWNIIAPFLAPRRFLNTLFLRPEPTIYPNVFMRCTGWLSTILISLGMFHGLITLIGIPCVIALLIYKWRRRHLSLYDSIEEFLQNQSHLIMPIRYSYSDIKRMTESFKDKLGEGGFGCVYKGKLRSGALAAVKMLGRAKGNGQDFINEVATIGRIHHLNVVQLVGYYAESSKRALVYDFMPNGSLDKYIFRGEGSVSLNWEKLFEISLGVARGIEYLHRGCDIQILHFDIKPHNILLDENFIPKLSDFGLAKLYPTKGSIASLTAARGTIGYMAPELFYKNIGRVSYKADVYSFGMLLLEIAGKRKTLNALVENSSQIYFPSWVYDQVSHGSNIEIGDATDEETELVKKMIIMGLWCIQMNPSNRPPMNRVVKMLEGDLNSLQLPLKPSLCFEEMPKVLEAEDSSYASDNCSDSISLIESSY